MQHGARRLDAGRGSRHHDAARVDDRRDDVRERLPVRGQRTHTNARTRKGPKRMQVAGKKKAGKK